MHPGVLIKTGKDVLKVFNISLQAREQGFDIGHGQVALWHWACRCYYATIHPWALVCICGLGTARYPCSKWCRWCIDGETESAGARLNPSTRREYPHP
jgi:hypothetical protein